MTRKLLFAATAALAISSCTQVEVDEVAATQKEPIRFEQFVSKATRGEDVTTANLTQFRVLCRKYQHGRTKDYDLTVKKGADGQWTYDDWLFWESGAKYQFAATNCTEEQGEFEIESTSEENFNLVCEKFENQVSGVDNNFDLVTAIGPVIEGKAAGNAPISLNFKHALAKVQVTFATEGFDTYTDVTMQGVKMGPEDVVAAFKQTANGSITWTPAGEDGEEGRHLYGNIVVPSSSEPQTRTMFVLPHKIKETDQISFQLLANEESGVPMTPCPWYNAYLLTDGVQEWEAGKAYNYKITVGPTEKFAFEVTVDDWSESQEETIDDLRDVSEADNAW